MFGISALNPLLLWGALGAAAPIIIHLLSKRRFKVVHWAAMDFLLEADQRNRRRVQLEDLIVLLLRCLACALIAMLVARLFFETKGLAAFAGQSSRFERIVLLDDSPSMGVLNADEGNVSTFELSKRGVTSLAQRLVAERSGDSFTLRLTSNPDEPVLNAVPLSQARLNEIKDAIDALKPSTRPAELTRAVATVERSLEESDGALNRVVYLVSDLRKRDWLAGDGQAGKSSAKSGGAGAVAELAKKVTRLVLIDAGVEVNANLTITDLRPTDKTVVAGIETEFAVTVRNDGLNVADDVELTVTAGESTLPVVRIESISPGESETATFTFNYQDVGPAPLRVSLSADALPFDNVRYYAGEAREGVQALIVDGDPDAEADQSEAFFLNRALNPPGDRSSGIAPQIVSENQFEGMPLDDVQVIFMCNVFRVTEDRMQALEAWVARGGGLIIFLGDQVDAGLYNRRLASAGPWRELRRQAAAAHLTLNFAAQTDGPKFEDPGQEGQLGQALAAAREALKSGDAAAGQNAARQLLSLNQKVRLVDDAGAFVMRGRLTDWRSPDNRLRFSPHSPNDRFGAVLGVKDESGLSLDDALWLGPDQPLSPISLVEVDGFQDERQWVTIRADETEHPVTRLFSGSDQPFVEQLKVFRYWKGEADAEDVKAGRVRVLARWSDTDASPAIVERRFEKGRVLVVTTSADMDWNLWARDYSYVVTAQEMARHMAMNVADRAGLSVGSPIVVEFDPTVHKVQSRLVPPDGEQDAVALEAVTLFDGGASSADGGVAATRGARQVFAHEETDTPGLYRLQMSRVDGGSDERLIGVNIEADEGRMARVGEPDLEDAFGDAPIEFVPSLSSLGGDDDEGRSELWRLVLAALIAVLCVEQALGWWFGRRR